jgi:allantoate deiminase
MVIARCREIAACTEVAGETTRPFLAPSQHRVHALLRGWMEAAGMSVSIDAVGNLRGLYPGIGGGKRLIIGSHLDTVPNAGAFDGVLGVVLGLLLVEELRGAALPFAPSPFDIEIVGFSEEEGVRFAKPFLGSLAFAGQFEPDTLERSDANGVTVAQAIREFGLDPAAIHEAEVSDDAFAYLEVHIEQGPVLESEDLSLGVVTAIVGQTRLRFTFTGQSNHAGTTPMHLRRDAMAAAATWIQSVELYAQAVPGLVATVGSVVTKPGISNVIASEVTASLDVRHADDDTLLKAVTILTEAATTYATARGVGVTVQPILQQKAVAADPGLTELLVQATANAGIDAMKMVSGAGHDAMIVARKLPVAILFLRSPDGLSHHPEETVRLEDVEAALAASIEFVKLLATQTTHSLRTTHTTEDKEAHA